MGDSVAAETFSRRPDASSASILATAQREITFGESQPPSHRVPSSRASSPIHALPQRHHSLPHANHREKGSAQRVVRLGFSGERPAARHVFYPPHSLRFDVPLFT